MCSWWMDEFTIDSNILKFLAITWYLTKIDPVNNEQFSETMKD